MTRMRLAAAAFIAAGLVATATPTYAQRRHGPENGRGQHAQARGRDAQPPRAQARGRDVQRPQAQASRGRQQQQRAQPPSQSFRPPSQSFRNERPQARSNPQPRQWRPQAQPRMEAQPRVQAQSRVQAQPRVQVEPRGQSQPRGNYRQPVEPRGGYRPEARRNDTWSQPYRNAPSDRRYNARPYVAPRSYSYRRPSYGYGGGYNNGYNNYRPYAHRSYAIPYGYHRHGPRGWSYNLYFGRPYGYYGGAAAYGYYPIAPGFVYGSVRIVDAPPEAQVFVDGYYAGVVDDYDGVFQHLNLAPGSHRLDIALPGYAAIGVDLFVEPGQTITYRANLY